MLNLLKEQRSEIERLKAENARLRVDVAAMEAAMAATQQIAS